MKELPPSCCPVPEGQQPANEYEELKSSWFFRWATLEPPAYWRKLACIAVWGWILASPIAAASFPPQKFPWSFFLSGSLGATLTLSLALLRLYLGWSYIRDRLEADKVIYEESGWYDGQIWPKPPEILARDRLIATYQVQPLLERLKSAALVLGAVTGSIGLGWLLLYPAASPNC